MPGPLAVLAPFAGEVRSLASAPDPVFAEGIAGPGVCLDPDRVAGVVHAPAAGVVAVLRPHAFVLQAEDGREILVHLGIDTAVLGAVSTTRLVTEGDRVAAGTPVLRWDPRAVAGAGHSCLTPLVGLKAAPARIRVVVGEGERVTAGQPVLEWS